VLVVQRLVCCTAMFRSWVQSIYTDNSVSMVHPAHPAVTSRQRHYLVKGKVARE